MHSQKICECGILPFRKSRSALAPLSGAPVERILSRKPKTLRELNEAWFGYHNPHPMHYDNHRYHSLNLNPVWETKQTVEIRAGNGTTHAGEAKSLVVLALAMVAKAKLAKAASGCTPREYNETRCFWGHFREDYVRGKTSCGAIHNKKRDFLDGTKKSIPKVAVTA